MLVAAPEMVAGQLSAPPYSALLSASVTFVDGVSPVHENKKPIIMQMPFL
jgi:hypothetical protein